MADLLLGICAATLEQADATLEAEHKWLCDNLDLIESLVADAEKMDQPSKKVNWSANEVLGHLTAYHMEAGWFLRGGRGLTFRDICEAIGADRGAALALRAPLFKLPFNVAAVMRTMRKLGVRKQNRS